MIAFKKISGSLTKITLIAALALALCFGSAGMAQAQYTPPQLLMVAVGISNYQKAPLASPHKDAQDLANLFRAQQGKLFSQVQAATLLNQQATVNNIHQALSWVRTRANHDTYTIVFLAGHGDNADANGEYKFSAFDGTIRWNQLRAALQNVPGKVILVLDSCHSGALTSGGNLIVFSSSLAYQESGETAQNGYFTQAFLEGLNGKADMNRDGKVTLSELDAYVSGRVEEISKGKQSSTLLRPANVPSSMPLALVSPAVTPTAPAMQPAVTFTGPAATPPVTQLSFQSSGPLGN